MLNFSRGRPFAVVRGGVWDGQLLRIYDKVSDKTTGEDAGDLHTSGKWSDPMDILTELGFFNHLKTSPKKNYEALRKVLVSTTKQPIDPEIEHWYNEAQRTLEIEKGRIFTVMDGTLELLPNPDPEKREQLWIASPTGSGKTHFACKYLAKYQQMFDRDVFIITKNVNDATIKSFEDLPDSDPDYLDPIIIDWTAKEKTPGKAKMRYVLALDPLDMKEFRDSAILWDDIEYMPDKELEEALEKARDDSMGVGRHDNITVINTGHLLTNYTKTRKILSEADYVVVYPQGGTIRGLDYFLREYLGSESKAINKRIKDLKSRWVCFHCKFPKFVLHSTGCFLL